MLEVIDLFKESDTVDELGVGSIRDAIAEGLFPGTSVLHTRLRYVLFIPWLLQLAAHKATTDEMSAEFRKLEYRLIGSLLAGGESIGVIGNRARNNLKRMPSDIYWAALGSWGVRLSGSSAEGYFRRQLDHRRLARRTAPTDDSEARELLPGTGLDPHLPGPPQDLLKVADFTVTAEEELYLSDVIAAATEGSMLAWLICHQPGSMTEYVWELDNLWEAPARLAELADHARRFHTAIHGAALVYNLRLARKSGRDEAVAQYEDGLLRWREEMQRTATMESWSRTGWWTSIERLKPVRPITRQFVDRWLNLVEQDADLARSGVAADLVATRERQIKGVRARLVNQAALDRWSGGSGLGRLDFRWTVAARHLQDLYTARAAS